MNNIQAICVLTNTVNNIKGVIEFTEHNKEVIMKINISGLSPGKHGFHIHEAGDLTDHCSGACSHFNPTNKTHGGPDDKERHIGDLGNLVVDKNGNVKKTMKDKYIKLNTNEMNYNIHEWIIVQ